MVLKVGIFWKYLNEKKGFCNEQMKFFEIINIYILFRNKYMLSLEVSFSSAIDSE